MTRQVSHKLSAQFRVSIKAGAAACAGDTHLTSLFTVCQEQVLVHWHKLKVISLVPHAAELLSSDAETYPSEKI